MLLAEYLRATVLKGTIGLASICEIGLRHFNKSQEERWSPLACVMPVLSRYRMLCRQTERGIETAILGCGNLPIVISSGIRALDPSCSKRDRHHRTEQPHLADSSPGLGKTAHLYNRPRVKARSAPGWPIRFQPKGITFESCIKPLRKQFAWHRFREQALALGFQPSRRTVKD